MEYNSSMRIIQNVDGEYIVNDNVKNIIYNHKTRTVIETDIETDMEADMYTFEKETFFFNIKRFLHNYGYCYKYGYDYINLDYEFFDCEDKRDMETKSIIRKYKISKLLK